MVLKLDPRVPLVWRDPFSLQLGVDPARVVLRDVTSAQERMIAALTAGISRSGLSMVAQSSGASEGEVERLLLSVGSVLSTPHEAAAAARVAITGVGETVDRIASTLAEAGLRVAVSPSPTNDERDLAIVVGHFVLEPESYGFWLRRDIPHLPVIFSDDSATVGPLIDPGDGPCLYCLEYHRRDADPSWSAIASQLWGRRSAAESGLLSREVAALASRLVLRRLAGGHPSEPGTGTSFRLATRTGEVTRRVWLPHPECGCIAVPRAGADAANEVRTGTDSAPALQLDSIPSRPRTTGDAAGRG